MRKLFLFSLLLSAACSKPNPDSCCATADQCLQYGFSGITPCQDNALVCNVDGACVTPQCRMDSDCNDPSLVCDAYGTCSPNPNTTPGQVKLSVQLRGSGVGSVTSDPPGISCTAGVCSGTFDVGTQVTLSQAASTGNFLGWTNDCRGIGTCSLTLMADRKVGALFGTKGEVLWSKQLSSSASAWGYGLAATPQHDIVNVGTFAGSFQLDTVMLQSEPTPTSINPYIAKFDGLTGEMNRTGMSGDQLS